MALTTLFLKNFRCFAERTIAFHPRLTVIEGPNGAGKSSILEGAHVAGTLRSFRTSSPRDMIRDQAEACFVRGTFLPATSPLSEEVAIAYSARERSAKRNGAAIAHRRDMRDLATIIMASEGDLAVVQGFPEMRRSFLDHALIASSPELYNTVQRHHYMARQRSILIMQGSIGELYRTWTEHYATATAELRVLRRAMLERLMDSLGRLIAAHGSALGVQEISAQYHMADSEDDWHVEQLAARELRAKRAMVGAQLDEIEWYVDGRLARRYTSRGFQKLLTLLLKLAQVHHATGERIFLLDDFITDFDEHRIAGALAALLGTDAQIVITVPHENHPAMRAACAQVGGLVVAVP